MANVTSSTVILQPLSTLTGDYPSATNGANGWAEVTVNYGDNVIVPITSGSTGSSAGTSNYGFSPNGSVGVTQGVLSFPGTTFSSSNTTINATISNIQTDGLISFWCQPSNGGSSVGWRARVKVNVNKDTTINLNKTVETINETATSYTNGLTNGGAGTIYYVFNVSSISNGTNLEALRSAGDTRYVARTFTTATSKPFSTDGLTATITNNLPTTGTFDTYYVYGANLDGQLSEYLGYSYTVGRADTSITLTPSATTITAASTANVTVNVTGDTSGTQYRLYTNNINRWVDTYNGGGSSTTDFTISYDEAPGGGAGTGVTELPGTGQTFTYFSQARAFNANAGWINTNNSFTITRSAAATYSVSASPTSINEGQSTTYTVTYSNVDSARTVNYAITGITSDDLSSGNLSGSFSISSGSGTATTSITLANDNLTDGSETATLTLASTDSTGASTGTPSASVTIADTSTAGSSGSGTDLQSGLTAGTYGLQIKNIAGTTTIIDDVSRIGTFLATATITFTSGGTNPQSAFAGFDCSSSSTTGIFINNWTGSAWLSPTIARSSNGITLTRNPSASSGVYGSCVLYLIRY